MVENDTARGSRTHGKDDQADQPFGERLLQGVTTPPREAGVRVRRRVTASSSKPNQPKGGSLWVRYISSTTFSLVKGFVQCVIAA
ncbi:hypothetical protein BZG35_14420 [Brevundimonas sp. LM2]|nr:hypothetical protein BZG35_14420 [Brevundimonas sp. LM2]